MSKILGLLARNMLLSVVSVVVGMLIFYLFSLWFNAVAQPDGFDFVWRREGTGTHNVERYYLTRDIFLIIGSVVGLVCSQVALVLGYVVGSAETAENGLS